VVCTVGNQKFKIILSRYFLMRFFTSASTLQHQDKQWVATGVSELREDLVI